jgi:hypothetical protein
MSIHDTINSSNTILIPPTKLEHVSKALEATCLRSRHCHISIAKVGVLVETIFSVDVTKLESSKLRDGDVTVKSEVGSDDQAGSVEYCSLIAESLAKALNDCWDSVGTVSSTLSGTCESLELALGDEAAVLLGDIFITCLKTLVGLAKSGNVDGVWKATMIFFKSVMLNSYTSKFVADSGDFLGLVEELFSLGKTMPQQHLFQLLECVSVMIHYPTLAAAFTDSNRASSCGESLFRQTFDVLEITETSGSQQVFAIELLNWSSWNQSLAELTGFADDLLSNSMKEISEIVPLWSSSSKLALSAAENSNGSWGLPEEDHHEDDISGDKHWAQSKRMTDILTHALEELVLADNFLQDLIRRTVSMLSTKSQFYQMSSIADNGSWFESCIEDALVDTKFYGTLATITAFLNSMSEIRTIVDWELDEASSALTSYDVQCMVRSCKVNLAAVLAVLASLNEYSITMVTKQSKQVNLMNSLLPAETAAQVPLASILANLDGSRTSLPAIRESIAELTAADILRNYGALFDVLGAVDHFMGSVHCIKDSIRQNKSDPGQSGAEELESSISRILQWLETNYECDTVISSLAHVCLEEMLLISVCPLISRMSASQEYSVNDSQLTLLQEAVEKYFNVSNVVDNFQRSVDISSANNALLGAYLMLRKTSLTTFSTEKISLIRLLSAVITGSDNEVSMLTPDIVGLAQYYDRLPNNVPNNDPDKLETSMMSDLELNMKTFLNSIVVQDTMQGTCSVSLCLRSAMACLTLFEAPAPSTVKFRCAGRCRIVSVMRSYFSLLNLYIGQAMSYFADASSVGQLSMTKVDTVNLFNAVGYLGLEPRLKSLASLGFEFKSMNDSDEKAIYDMEVVSLLDETVFVFGKLVLHLQTWLATLYDPTDSVVHTSGSTHKKTHPFNEMFLDLVSCTAVWSGLLAKNLSENAYVMANMAILVRTTTSFCSAYLCAACFSGCSASSLQFLSSMYAIAHELPSLRLVASQVLMTFIGTYVEYSAERLELEALTNNGNVLLVPFHDEDIPEFQLKERHARTLQRSDQIRARLETFLCAAGTGAGSLVSFVIEVLDSESGMALCQRLLKVSPKLCVVILTAIVKDYLVKLQQFLRIESCPAEELIDIQLKNKPGAKEVENIVLEIRYSRLRSICRKLVLINTLAQDSSCVCIGLVAVGVMKPLMQALRGTQQNQLLVLSLHCVELILRAGNRLLSANDRNITDLNSPNKVFSMIRTSDIFDYVSRTISADLPGLLSRTQDSEDRTFVWLQATQLLPFLRNLTAAGAILSTSAVVKIEALAVHLWLAFEEAYQMVVELLEFKKHIVNVDAQQLMEADVISVRECDEVLHEAHAQLCLAVFALRAVLDVTLVEFDKGNIPLATLSKSVRYTSGDPKKAMVRFQRGYTMWASQYISQSQRQQQVNGASGRSTASHRDEEFDSRHGLVLASLKALLEGVSKIVKCVTSKEDKYCRGNFKVDAAVEVEIDLSSPYMLDNDPDAAATVDANQQFICDTVLSEHFKNAVLSEQIGLTNLRSAARAANNIYHSLVMSSSLFGRGHLHWKTQLVFEKKSKLDSQTGAGEIWRAAKQLDGLLLDKDDMKGFNWSAIDEDKIKFRGDGNGPEGENGSRKRSRFSVAVEEPVPNGVRQELPPPPPLAPMMIAPTLQLAPTLSLAPSLAPALAPLPSPIFGSTMTYPTLPGLGDVPMAPHNFEGGVGDEDQYPVYGQLPMAPGFHQQQPQYMAGGRQPIGHGYGRGRGRGRDSGSGRGGFQSNFSDTANGGSSHYGPAY